MALITFIRVKEDLFFHTLACLASLKLRIEKNLSRRFIPVLVRGVHLDSVFSS